jgi:hypothetical protein
MLVAGVHDFSHSRHSIYLIADEVVIHEVFGISEDADIKESKQ